MFIIAEIINRCELETTDIAMDSSDENGELQISFLENEFNPFNNQLDAQNGDDLWSNIYTDSTYHCLDEVITQSNL